MSGCSDPDPVTRGECGENLSSKPRLDGPLEADTGLVRVSLNRDRAPMDFGMIWLKMPAGQEVTIDSVQLEPEVGVVAWRRRSW